jgi:solute carrier family 50 protein (sugar transporter)
MPYDGFVEFLSVTATASTIGLFLCGIQICSRIRQRGSTEGTAVAPFLLTSISCICWLGYGVIRSDRTVIFVNTVGFIVQSIYLYYYFIKTRVKSRLNKLLTFELLVAVGTYYFVYGDTSQEGKENILGIICMVLNILTIGSPLFDIGQVIRSKSTESLPFMLCVGNMVVSVQWLLYGVLVDDFYMKVPNAVAVVISAIQLSLFVIYPATKIVIAKVPNDVL